MTTTRLPTLGIAANLVEAEWYAHPVAPFHRDTPADKLDRVIELMRAVVG